MTDLALNEDFDIFLDDRNDVATVEGRASFEQSVAINLTTFMYNVTGEADFQTMKEKVRLQVGRVARKHEEIANIDRIVVERHPEKPGTVAVELVYSGGDSFATTFNL